MTVPFSLVVIKPMSIGRGHGPKILEELLSSAPLVLRRFRAWNLCQTTLRVLCESPSLEFEDEKIHLGRSQESWICLFTHVDRQTDPSGLIEELCGPLDKSLWRQVHLRMRYSGFGKQGGSTHPSDTVFHISSRTRRDLEASLLLSGSDIKNL